MFASKREAKRYGELKLLQRAGVIRSLELQPKMLLSIPASMLGSGGNVGTYIADFRYFDVEKDCVVIEDVKGMKTPVYRLKKKLVEALYPVTILET